MKRKLIHPYSFLYAAVVSICAVFIAVSASFCGEIHYVVHRTTDRLAIDGNITEPDWHNANAITDFVFPWHTGGEKEQTLVKLLWDDDNLYVYYKCDDKHISAHHYERNSAVSRDDCVEIFIASNPAHPLWYANYEFNCIGTYLVGYNLGDERGVWEPEGLIIGRSHRGTINNDDDRDEYWILEVAIPFHNFTRYGAAVPPKDGDIWRINLNRCGGDVNPQYSQWTASKTPKPNYHRPEDFNAIMFTVKPAGQ